MTANMITKARMPPTPPIRALLLPLLELDVLRLESGLEDVDSVCSDEESVDVVEEEKEVMLMVECALALVLLFPVVVVTCGRDGVPNNAGDGNGHEIPPGIDHTVPACGCVVLVPAAFSVSVVVVVAIPVFILVCDAAVSAVEVPELELSLDEFEIPSWPVAFPSGQTPKLHGSTEQQPLKLFTEQV